VSFLRAIERERVANVTIVGDAFASPILDEMDRHSYDVSSLVYLANGGAPLSVANKRALLEHFPKATIHDGIGASETGGQATSTVVQGDVATAAVFALNPEACVLSDDRSRVVAPDDDAIGWLAQRDRVPLGYLDDPVATAATFPVIDGIRYAVPGDRARHRSDGTIAVLGRDAVTVNSGGEKIFVEEVEQALKDHPGVYDAVVAGRPSEPWGEEVVAIVQLRPGSTATAADLLQTAGTRIARFKLPKAFVFVDEIVRSPSGKADYRWAREAARRG
jgi:acyl-CoA synthetase (AMP-forming)/AMP-acid ligase II